ncbi:ABC transporter permease [Sphingomonas sp. SUN039]|uniref:ABC transporter permease n=1 Tax=Sphingomonas sp. SUN039 TaxID=2937787 RepID=UPI002164069F|nr:ABC transporter permease [Sphingomonas sp. SUN039]UVO54999.1 ABC transporter permease [Sphingomonas sp. SUN039]
MNNFQRLFAAALVIARRDYVATVWSRSFVMFLLTPIIAIGFGGVIGSIGNRVDEAAMKPVVAVVAPAAAFPAFRAAQTRLDDRIEQYPGLRLVAAAGDPDRQAAALLGEGGRAPTLVLTGWPGKLRLHGPDAKLKDMASDVEMLAEEAALDAQLARGGQARPAVTLEQVPTRPVATSSAASRHLLGRAAQTMLFMLTILLAGMLLSNLVEEKSNKVIEVLTAAVPVDAIFLGKLVAMLGVSVTGIAIWGAAIGVGLVGYLGTGALPAPAMGWPMLIVLGVAYYVSNYMILGGIFIGIGSQAASVRDVQTLSMPVTMLQLAIFALGSAVVSSLDSPLGVFAAMFPLSSPLTMIARAAQEAALWPHLLALAWQALWVVIIIRFAARRFRTGVLKSGSPPKERRWFGRRLRA